MRICALLVVVLMAGCGVNTYEWEKAQKICEGNGGLVGVYSDFGATVAKCRNGVRLQLKKYKPTPTTTGEQG